MYYKHSGRFNIWGMGFASIAGMAASILLAAIYVIGLILIPEMHLAALAPMVFGGLIGVAVGYALVWGKVRNERVALSVAGIVSCFALYASWAMWVQTILTIEHVRTVHWMKLARRPRDLWNLICLINQHGTWGFDKGSPTTGWMLWLIWLLEAATVIGLGMLAAPGIVQRRPFCEACGCWCKRGAKVLLTPPQDLAQLKLQLESNDFRPLESLGPGGKKTDHLIVLLDSCKHCCQFHTLSLTHVMFRRNKLGQAHINHKMIVKQLMIGPGEAETLRQLTEKVTQAAKITPPKVNASAAGK